MTLPIKHCKNKVFGCFLAAVSLAASPTRIFATNDPGEGDQVKKEKKISKSYTVTAEDQLKIDNQFGQVVVNTWDKNEITVDIEIEAEAPNEEKAAAALNILDIKEHREGHLISLLTTFTVPTDFVPKPGDKDEIKHKELLKRMGAGNVHHSFQIDYVIHMPAVNRLSILNQFGKTEVPDFKGLVTLTSKFGSLHTGKLENVDVISVEFGKASIAGISNGKLIFNYSEARIQKLGGSVKLSSEFSHNVELGLTDDIRELSLSGSYSDLQVVVSKNISAEFNIHTSFGKLLNESGIEMNESEKGPSGHKPHFDKDYKGRSGDGKGKIKITSSFGKVRLTNHMANHSEGKTN